MDKRIKKFFDKHISTLHKQVSAGEVSFLELEMDKSKDSYFSLPVYPDYLYLNTIGFSSERDLESSLKELWKSQPALLELVDDLVILAFALKKDNNERSVELSPFVYEMF